MKTTVVDILLATFNGAPYLEEQLASVFEQTYDETFVYVHDDGSADETLRIIGKWKSIYPNRMRIIRGTQHKADAGQSFFDLLSASSGRYAMFCDQDDVWLPRKVENSLRRIMIEEERYARTPILLHTDLTVTDEHLNTIAPSFVRNQGIDPSRTALPQLMVQNNVTGCTMIMNRHLIELARRPPAPILHDRWIALTASAFGRIVYVPDRTVLYRQHNSNVVGARRTGVLSHVLEKVRDLSAVRRSLHDTYYTAHSFMNVYRDLLSSDHLHFLAEYSTLQDAKLFERFRILSKHKAFKKSLLKALLQIVMG